MDKEKLKNTAKKFALYFALPAFLLFVIITAVGHFYIMPRYAHILLDEHCEIDPEAFPLYQAGSLPGTPREIYVDSKTLTAPENRIIVVDRNGSEMAVLLVEIADTDEKRQTGLMHRHRLDERSGMLFVLEEVRHTSFWMKDTHLPLDIIFLNRDGTVAHLHENARPRSLASIPSTVPVWAVLELNAGEARMLDLVPGGARLLHPEFDADD